MHARQHVQNFMKADNVYLWFALLVFALMMLVLIRVSDHFGRALVSLRHFIQSADRGLIDYAHIEFPHTELGDIGRSIMLKYKQLEATGPHKTAIALGIIEIGDAC